MVKASNSLLQEASALLVSFFVDTDEYPIQLTLTGPNWGKDVKDFMKMNYCSLPRPKPDEAREYFRAA